MDNRVESHSFHSCRGWIETLCFNAPSIRFTHAGVAEPGLMRRRSYSAKLKTMVRYPVT